MLSWGLVGCYFFVVHVVVEKHHVVLGVSWVLLFCRACQWYVVCYFLGSR